ncbi:Aminotransferase, class I and II [Plesiocystis pacifica SIR-1]|uniref:Aminotransferase, class I and II n=1 Tax=Plesiocystis pacifica SIR-1 TaxID=391625 RepID=A6G3Q4_9BACT|nr:pyridoxal phosphate-dependent aminotransferase [Plesiocystis pacifica]EDM79441.1 Aminotransferase, class I and II [Plesiocystis pacifica SIR-1]
MSGAASMFRPVPRTGVIYVMTEASQRGFHYGHPEWCNLGQGAPQTGPLPGSEERLATIGLDAQSSEYAPVPGLWELREAVARLYNHRYRRGKASQYGPENVAIAAGGRVALTRLATALGRVNLGHLLPDYTAYEELLDVFRAFVPIPIVLREREGFRLAPETLREVIVGSGLGAVLASNPCNPTGRLIAGEDLRRYVSIARKHGCALILDEFYSHYIYGPPSLRHQGELPRSVSACKWVEDVNEDPVVVVDGLTKNWRYPGLRISWTVGPKAVIDRVSSAGSFLDGGAPHCLQQAAIPLLEPELADREAAAIQATFSAKRAMMLEQLSAMGIRVAGDEDGGPEGAFYCFADLRELPAPLNDGMAFFRAALERQVICVPGVFFDIDPGNRREHIASRLSGFVRLSFGPDIEQLRTGLERMAAMIAEAR